MNPDWTLLLHLHARTIFFKVSLYFVSDILHLMLEIFITNVVAENG